MQVGIAGDIGDGGGGYVSTHKEHAGPETLTVHESRTRKIRMIRSPHSMGPIWKQMEDLAVEDGTTCRHIVGGKRKFVEEEEETKGDSVERVAKRSKSVDEILSETLAECLDSDDEEYSTYLASEQRGEDGWKEEDEELVLSLVMDYVSAELA